jgi:acyl-coenzyme A synthetase/AMP-(fatty) acid ligase
MSVFLRDIKQGSQVTWESLIDDINAMGSFNPYCKSDNYYELFRQIILSLLLEEEIILLDSDFRDEELVNLTGYSDYKAFEKPIDRRGLPSLSNKQELISRIKNTSKNWKITLFTSGTTGLPKKVSHDFESITRFVKLSERNEKSIWGFAYNPTHMAGIQVFFQSLLNGNAIIRLFGLNPREIYEEIKRNHISHLSATPTFYRLLLPCEDSFPSVVRITSGGEKFNEKIFAQLKETFPNSKITNIYASTEAGSLFASENDVFVVKPAYEPFVKLGSNNELLLHSSLIGLSDGNTEEWYNTNDLLEVIQENPLRFRFISRNSDMINVGGYKVNPLEVEETLLLFPGIQNAQVYPKRNSVLGNIICCDVVCSDVQVSEASIRTFLQSKLQEFKIPRIIRFVDQLSTTRTGKIKRN